MVRGISRYVEEEITAEHDQATRQALVTDYGRLYSNTSPELRQAHPGRALRAYAPRLAKRSLTRRYDDLFEELMKYMDEEDIITREDYKEHLKAIMNPRLVEGTLSTRNVDNLYGELVDTPRAKEFFRTRNIEQVTPETERRHAQYIRETRRGRYQELVREGHEVYRVVNPKDKTVTVVFKGFVTEGGVKREAWRDVNNGRFGLNPYKLRALYT